MNFEPTEQVTLFKFSDSVQLKSHKLSGETGWIQMRVQTEALLNRKYKHW